MNVRFVRPAAVQEPLPRHPEPTDCSAQIAASGGLILGFVHKRQ